MLLFRYGPEGFHAAGASLAEARVLYSDPLATPVSQWELGRPVDLSREALRAPIVPGKLVGIGRNYREHAAELGNPMPPEPVIFLKAPSSVIGPGAPIVLPPESARVEHEGELAVVVGARLTRASREEARAAVLGVTCACDVTARDLQKRDVTFARAKSFDTFCPLGPALALGLPEEPVEVVTRVSGVERQRGSTAEMEWGPLELLVYVSRMMTLEPGDVILTGTPSGVGPLADGDRVEVEIAGIGILANPVEAWKRD